MALLLRDLDHLRAVAVDPGLAGPLGHVARGRAHPDPDLDGAVRRDRLDPADAAQPGPRDEDLLIAVARAQRGGQRDRRRLLDRLRRRRQRQRGRLALGPVGGGQEQVPRVGQGEVRPAAGGQTRQRVGVDELRRERLRRRRRGERPTLAALAQARAQVRPTPARTRDRPRSRRRAVERQQRVAVVAEVVGPRSRPSRRSSPCRRSSSGTGGRSWSAPSTPSCSSSRRVDGRGSSCPSAAGPSPSSSSRWPRYSSDLRAEGDHAVADTSAWSPGAPSRPACPRRTRSSRHRWSSGARRFGPISTTMLLLIAATSLGARPPPVFLRAQVEPLLVVPHSVPLGVECEAGVRVRERRAIDARSRSGSWLASTSRPPLLGSSRWPPTPPHAYGEAGVH